MWCRALLAQNSWEQRNGVAELAGAELLGAEECGAELRGLDDLGAEE